MKAKDIEILGSVESNVQALHKVYVRNGAQFLDDIQSAGIVIEGGGLNQRQSRSIQRHRRHRRTLAEGPIERVKCRDQPHSHHVVPRSGSVFARSHS
jgi:hypothetical protein